MLLTVGDDTYVQVNITINTIDIIILIITNINESDLVLLTMVDAPMFKSTHLILYVFNHDVGAAVATNDKVVADVNFVHRTKG